MEMVLVNICLFELSSCTDEISPLNLTLLILELRWDVKKDRVGLASASHQSESIPFMFQQCLKQSRKLCLPFRSAS